ncbi:MAG: hypothetical protein OXI54_04500 [Chloroflexota bacterium]|nr:hypothetical protein [Chloroflexota bacterium]
MTYTTEGDHYTEYGGGYFYDHYYLRMLPLPPDSDTPETNSEPIAIPIFDTGLVENYANPFRTWPCFLQEIATASRDHGYEYFAAYWPDEIEGLAWVYAVDDVLAINLDELFPFPGMPG